MQLKESQKREEQAKEVWIVSPRLYYDINEEEYPSVVSKNLGEGVKYRYIIPGTEENLENVESFKEKFDMSEKEAKSMFLLLPPNEMTPFMAEVAIYDPHEDNCSCSLSLQSDCCMTDDVIRFDDNRVMSYVDNFKALWKRYKRDEV